jgi:molybdopterin-binding protein
LLLRTPGGAELTAVVVNRSANADQIQRGDNVFCQVHADDVVILMNQFVAPETIPGLGGFPLD